MAIEQFTWEDIYKIGLALSREHPQLEPDNVGLQDLHRLVTQLKDFRGDPSRFDQARLDAIRSAWNMEFLERTQ